MGASLLVMIVGVVLDRLREPSSHAGCAAGCQAIKYFVPVEWQPVADAATGLFSALAVALAEKGGL